jgi:HTH-type transcriptional regulator/antitoxin HigA
MQEQCVMKTKILKTEQEYNEACERIYTLINITDKAIEANSTEGEEMELLSLLVEKYERDHYPIEAPNPIEAIKFRMEQMNLKQSDIAPLFGGKTRVSEVLCGKRPLSLKMITLLNRYLGIPLESLVIGNKEVKLEPEKKEKLMGIASIKEYISSSRAAII